MVDLPMKPQEIEAWILCTDVYDCGDDEARDRREDVDAMMMPLLPTSPPPQSATQPKNDKHVRQATAGDPQPPRGHRRVSSLDCVSVSDLFDERTTTMTDSGGDHGEKDRRRVSVEFFHDSDASTDCEFLSPDSSAHGRERPKVNRDVVLALAQTDAKMQPPMTTSFMEQRRRASSSSSASSVTVLRPTTTNGCGGNLPFQERSQVVGVSSGSQHGRSLSLPGSNCGNPHGPPPVLHNHHGLPAPGQKNHGSYSHRKHDVALSLLAMAMESSQKTQCVIIEGDYVKHHSRKGMAAMMESAKTRMMLFVMLSDAAGARAHGRHQSSQARPDGGMGNAIIGDKSGTQKNPSSCSRAFRNHSRFGSGYWKPASKKNKRCNSPMKRSNRYEGAVRAELRRIARDQMMEDVRRSIHRHQAHDPSE